MALATDVEGAGARRAIVPERPPTRTKKGSTMRLTVDALLIDTSDPELLAGFYEDLLGFVRTFEDEGEVMIAAPDGSGFPLLFVEVDDAKAGKNRLHLDLRPDDQRAAVARALELGATPTDVGQDADPDVTWVVLADPDGNEFCILSPSGDPVDEEDLQAPEDALPLNVRAGLVPQAEVEASDIEEDDDWSGELDEDEGHEEH
jgi:predicted enzyme related to lactoylglutathione lyase